MSNFDSDRYYAQNIMGAGGEYARNAIGLASFDYEGTRVTSIVRWSHVHSYRPDNLVTYDVSPFPGAWISLPAAKVDTLWLV